jgi:bifunctional diaminopimelate decarboxylase / aspartate kinase
MVIVHKFGGTSQSLKGYNIIKDLIINSKEKVFIVVSAVKGITNLLVELSNNYSQEIVNKIIGIHEDFIKELNFKYKIDLSYFYQKLSPCTTLQDKINLISLGEFISCNILYNYLKMYDVHIEILHPFVIQSDKENSQLYNDGNFYCDVKDIYEDNNTHSVNTHSINYVMPGFSGVTPTHQIFLIGRGGSDTSGALLANGLNASRYYIWTDVEGVYSIDPRIIYNKDSIRLIKKLDYQSAKEMAGMGAKVLHPYCINPCYQKNIPIEIKNTFNSEVVGTEIYNYENNNDIYGILIKRDVVLFKIYSMSMWNNHGFVNDIFEKFKDYKVDVNIINTSEFDIITSTNDTDIEKLLLLKERLEEKYQVELITNIGIINIVGNNLIANDKIKDIFDYLKDKKIYISNFSSNKKTLSFGVDSDKLIDIANDIHNIVFKYYNFDIITQSVSHNIIDDIKSRNLDLYRPYYYYDFSIIDKNVNRLLKMSAIDQVYYAVKANFNPVILKYLSNYNIGFETVSIEEIELLKKLDINNNILFTPNFCDLYDYRQALMVDNVKIVLDNLSILLGINGDTFKNKSIGLRIDLNYAQGHHDKVKTQGKKSKFGISYNNIINNLKVIKKVCVENNIIIDYLHTHMGSDINDYNNWLKIYEMMEILSLNFKELSNNNITIDIGGGFNYNVDLEKLNEELLKLKNNNNNIKLAIEPGRFIVANSGYLIGKVNQIKMKDDLKYIGTNIGMNLLMRPALYNAIHPIYFNSKMTSNKSIVNVVGPICESGDVLIKELTTYKNIKEDDMVVVLNVGAYGESMKSNYNLKDCNIIYSNEYEVNKFIY